jgi:hypothetical protein
MSFPERAYTSTKSILVLLLTEIVTSSVVGFGLVFIINDSLFKSVIFVEHHYSLETFHSFPLYTRNKIIQNLNLDNLKYNETCRISYNKPILIKNKLHFPMLNS